MEPAKPALIRETFPVGPLQCNCTIIGDPVTKQAIVVDPGGNPELIMARLEAHGLKVVSIIHTHAHLDHFLASGQMKEKTGATLHLHKADQFLWDGLEMQCRMFGVPYVPVPAPDQWWGGDYPTIERSIKQRLYSLDEDATVITGHGAQTRLGDEMRENPFVRA